MDSAGAEAGLRRGQLMFKSDRFCWVCHTNEPDFMWRCPTCPRSYHCGCCVREMPGYPRPTVDRPGGTDEVPKFVMKKCPECLVGKSTFEWGYPTMKGRSQEDVKQILHNACLALRSLYLDNPYVDILKVEEPEYPETVGKVVDIQRIETLVEQGQIETLEGFMGELKWIYHNSVIFDGKTSPICAQSLSLVEAGLQEVKAVVACPDCYLSSKTKNSAKDNAWYLKTCNPPHILAWAKHPNFPWWPTKIRSIDGDTVSVMFFSDGKNADISLKNCRLYSNEVPDSDSKSKRKTKNPTKKYNEAMKKALTEINSHIKDLEKRYGPVVLAANGNSPMVKELDLEGLRVMFPDYKK